MQSLLVFAMALGAASASGTPPAKPAVVAFDASVQVDLDASGKPLKVHAPSDLPPTIREYVEKRVGSWSYTPATRAGIAVPATTYVKVGACAIPEATGNYRMAVDFKWNGPGIANPYNRFTPPEYPARARILGVTGTFVVVLQIRDDGSADALSITPTDTNGRPAQVREITASLKRWARSQRFSPERVAGELQATQMRIPVNFVLDGGIDRSDMREAIRDQIRQRGECQMAGAQEQGPAPVAVESAVKVAPAPAG